MKAEDKQLLLKDLCARLPYGVKIHKALYGATTLNERDIESFRKGFDDILIPYLRPMSSMTKEEEKEFHEQRYKAKPYSDNKSYNIYEVTGLNVDWLNAHHFDYHGLIEKGLAVEAPEGMYND